MIRVLLLLIGLMAALWVGWQVLPTAETATPAVVATPEPAPAPQPEPEPSVAPTPPAPPEAAKVAILTAARDISSDALLQAADFVWTEITMDRVVPGTIRQDSQPEALDELTGLVSVVPIKKGDPISFATLQEPQPIDDLSTALSSGNSALAIAVSAETAVGGFIKPGDQVDVIFLPSLSPDGTAPAPRLLASGARVLAVDGSTMATSTPNPAEISTITLELSQSEVISVSQATIMGRVSVALRARGDMPAPILAEQSPDAIRVIRQSGIELMEPAK